MSNEAVMEAPMTERQKWRSMLDMLPLVEVEIASAQQARADANEAFELAKRKHFDDVAAANHAEQAGEYSRRKIEEARAKLLESAPDAVRKRIDYLVSQIDGLRFGSGEKRRGTDHAKQLRHEMETAERVFSVTKDPKNQSEYEQLKFQLEKLEYQLAGLERELNEAVAEALMVD